MSRQLKKSGANSRQPSKQAHSGVSKHCSRAAQQFCRKQDWQLGLTGPSHSSGGHSPEEGSPSSVNPEASVGNVMLVEPGSPVLPDEVAP